MIEALQYDFMRNAVLAGLLVSFACGMIGSLIVVNRMVFISGGIAHAAYGGIGLAVVFGLPPLFGAGVFSVFIACIIGVLSLRKTYRMDTIIGALWAAGMAVGIICIDRAGGYRTDLMSYLFGSILAVPTADLWFTAGLDSAVLLFVVFFYHDLLAMSYDAEYAGLRRVPVRALHLILLGVSALTVVMTIRVVGLILVIALLTIPTYISEEFSGSLGRMMVFSTFLSAVFTITGLYLSFSFNLTSGASIIMVSTTSFFIVFLFSALRKSARHS
jgi:zinc transport system permease protein